MWCPQCQAEVAAEASASDWRLLCTTCGTEVRRQPDDSRTITPPPAIEAGRISRNPRELLARWAEEDATDPLGLPRPVVPLATTSRPASTGERAPRATAPPELSSGLWGERTNAAAAPNAAPGEDSPPSSASANPEPSTARNRIRRPLRLARSGAIYAERSRADETSPGGERWLPLIGQMFAYLGVVTLFVGSVLVLLGYFGGIPAYAPTGWIIATAGQMLLFLGVVTLISAGLQQTSDAVREALERYSSRLDRLELLLEETVVDSDQAVPGRPRVELVDRFDDGADRRRAA